MNFFADKDATARASNVYLAAAGSNLSEVAVSYPDTHAADNALEEARSVLAGCHRDQGVTTWGTEDTYEATAKVVRRDLAPADDELDVQMSVRQHDLDTPTVLRHFDEDVVVFRAANNVIVLVTNVGSTDRRHS